MPSSKGTSSSLRTEMGHKSAIFCGGSKIAQGELYPIPLEVCVADTQAGMGYMIAQCLMNELRQRGAPRPVTTVVTTIVVDADDPAFQHPSKPIGPRMQPADAQRHVVQDGWQVQEVAGHYFRRVVPSPSPREILELATIRQLVEGGELVICCGGGGIPVVRSAEGDYQGAAAVIDKDRSSALLASQLGCATLVILTSVSHAYLDFDTDRQRPLHTVTAEEARRYLAAGQFAAGSMRPKIEAAIQFVSQSPTPHPVAVIAHLDDLVAAIGGRSGTRVTRGAG